MNQLDERLKEIVWDASDIASGIDDFGAFDKADQEKMVDEVVAQIKQAFIDEGYIQIPQVEVVTRWERGKKPEVYMVNGKKVMTGQEWLERFMLCMQKEILENEGITTDEQIVNIAKRAANIEEIDSEYGSVAGGEQAELVYKTTIAPIKEAYKRASGVSEPTEPKVVINKYEGHKHSHDYALTKTLPYRDVNQDLYAQNSFSCKCGAGKFERTLMKKCTEPTKHYSDSSGSDMWPDTSPNAKERVTEL